MAGNGEVRITDVEGAQTAAQTMQDAATRFQDGWASAQGAIAAAYCLGDDETSQSIKPQWDDAAAKYADAVNKLHEPMMTNANNAVQSTNNFSEIDGHGARQIRRT